MHGGKMKKLIGVVLLLLCLPLQASAMKVGGVDIAEKINFGHGKLTLNGAGIRTKFMFKIYVVALYLNDKRKSAADVLADTGPKRIALHITHTLTGGDFMEAFNKAVNANQTPQEYTQIAARLIHFSRVFREVGEVKKGDLITLDYAPEIGTIVAVNGKEHGRVKGADFYAVLLKVWLGPHPVQDNVKQDLLGG